MNYQRLVMVEPIDTPDLELSHFLGDMGEASIVYLLVEGNEPIPSIGLPNLLSYLGGSADDIHDFLGDNLVETTIEYYRSKGFIVTKLDTTYVSLS